MEKNNEYLLNELNAKIRYFIEIKRTISYKILHTEKVCSVRS